MDRRRFASALAAGSVAMMASSGKAAVPRARVRGDVAAPGPPIDRRVYGQNLEFMGRQFKGGIIADSDGQAPTFGKGFRLDVREALADMGVTHLRWPGGCFADAYCWRDGIGDNRPGYINPMWGKSYIKLGYAALGETKTPVGSYMDNRFGTHEFMDYCRELGAEPSITASMEDKDPDRAAEWVAYLRDQFGEDAVPVWSVGNEQWNPLEHNGNFLRPGRYVKRYLRWAEAMRRENPKIKLVASGQDQLLDPKWNRELLAGIGRQMDYLSSHIYVPFKFLARDLPDTEDTYLSTASCYRYVEESFKRVREAMDKTLGESIPISFDEWNILAGARNFIAPRATMTEALGAAGIIHAILRNAGLVRLANQFAPVNAASPAIVTDRDRMARTPMFHVLRLYRGNTRERTAPVTVSSPAFASKKLARVRAYSDTPYIDAVLTVDHTSASLFLVNRHPRKDLETEVEIDGIKPGADATLHLVAGPESFKSENRIGEPERVITVTRPMPWPVKISLPPCSVAALDAKIT